MNSIAYIQIYLAYAYIVQGESNKRVDTRKWMCRYFIPYMRHVFVEIINIQCNLNVVHETNDIVHSWLKASAIYDYKDKVPFYNPVKSIHCLNEHQDYRANHKSLAHLEVVFLYFVNFLCNKSKSIPQRILDLDLHFHQ